MNNYGVSITWVKFKCAFSPFNTYKTFSDDRPIVLNGVLDGSNLSLATEPNDWDWELVYVPEIIFGGGSFRMQCHLDAPDSISGTISGYIFEYCLPSGQGGTYRCVINYLGIPLEGSFNLDRN